MREACKLTFVLRSRKLFSAIYVLKHQLYIGHFTDESLTLHGNENRVTESSLHHCLIRKGDENKKKGGGKLCI